MVMAGNVHAVDAYEEIASGRETTVGVHAARNTVVGDGTHQRAVSRREDGCSSTRQVLNGVGVTKLADVRAFGQQGRFHWHRGIELCTCCV